MLRVVLGLPVGIGHALTLAQRSFLLVDVHSSAVGAREWTVAAHLEGCDATVIRLYERFVELVQACGEFEVTVSKTAISFKGTRRGFAGAKPKQRWLDGYLDLQRPVADPRIRRASSYTKRLFVHQFRVTGVDQLDEEFAGWVREAYAVGQGRHLEAAD
jgi:Domain of unknown function (DUF5655)